MARSTNHHSTRSTHQPPRWHFSEFAAFAGTQIELHLAEGDRGAAKSWLEMWRQADPDHPSLEYFEQQLGRKTNWRDQMHLQ